MRKRGLLLVVAVSVAAVVSGCSFFGRVGLRATEDRRPIVEIARCDGERVTSVELLDGTVTSAPVMWRVESGGVALDEVTVGTTPDGFVSTKPLVATVRSDETYLIVVRGEQLRRVTFRPGDLDPRQVLVGDRYEALETFRARAGGSCSPFEFSGWIVAFFVGWMILWVLGLVFWIVKIVQVARIPEHQYRAAGNEKLAWVLVVVLANWIGALVWHFGPRKRVLAAEGVVPMPRPGWYMTPNGWAWWDGQQWLPPPPPR